MQTHDLRQPRTTRPTVLVVEDEWLVAKHIQSCLQSAGFHVLSPVHSARAAVEQAAASMPDVIVMDIKLDGDSDGISAATEISRRYRTPVVYLTAMTDRDTVTRAANANAAAFVIKPFVERQLVSAVLLASHAGGRLTTGADPRHPLEEKFRAIAAVVNGAPIPAQAHLHQRVDGAAGRLSPRERELVSMLSHGERVSSIARKLGLSTHTVRNHLKSIFRKLDIHSQHELVEFWRGQPGFDAH